MTHAVRTLSHLISLLVSAAMLAACSPAASNGGVAIAQSSKSRLEASSSTQADLQNVITGNTVFALTLYQNLASQKGNLFFSPYSISQALGMTAAGARGETSTQMEKGVFGFGE